MGRKIRGSITMKEDARLEYTSWSREESAARDNPKSVHMTIINQMGVQQDLCCHSHMHVNFLKDGNLLTYITTPAVSGSFWNIDDWVRMSFAWAISTTMILSSGYAEQMEKIQKSLHFISVLEWGLNSIISRFPSSPGQMKPISTTRSLSGS